MKSSDWSILVTAPIWIPLVVVVVSGITLLACVAALFERDPIEEPPTW